MPRVFPRHPYVRRLRIHRAIARYRRSRRARVTLIAGSLTTIAISVALVMLATRSAGDQVAMKPLFQVDGPKTRTGETVNPPLAIAREVRLAAQDDDQVAQPADAWTRTADQVAEREEPAEPAAAAMAVADPQRGAVHAALPDDLKRFNGRPVRAVAQRRMLVTAYCPCAHCCGKNADGITAAGYSVFTNGGKLVAADTRILPFGTLLSVPGYARTEAVPVLDTGKAIKGNRLDVFFASHAKAKRWGARWLTVTIYDYVD
jgi:3D (Asp-Asp-Asp) domain-containing protein